MLRCGSRLVVDRCKKSFIHRTKDLKYLKQVARGYHVFRNAPSFSGALLPTTAHSQASTIRTRYTKRYAVEALVTCLDAHKSHVKPTARLCKQGTKGKCFSKGI